MDGSEKPLHELSITEAGCLLRGGALRSSDLTRHALSRIARLDGTYRAFAHLDPESALKEAGAADAALAEGIDLGPLHGIPYALKDMIDAASMPTRAGSRLRQGHVATRDAAVTAAMRKAGAVLLGKVATYEFATVGPAFDLPQPPAVNPRAPDHITGGSSSGSAAAVAAGYVRLSIGTDSGGSVRNPACYCGVVGLKPSFGLVPMDGILPLTPSLDHAGILAASVEDAAICLDVLSSGTSAIQSLGERLEGICIAYGRNWSAEEAVPEVQAALDRAADRLRELGASVEEVTLPDYAAFEKCGTVILQAEAFALHSQDIKASGDSYGRSAFASLMSGQKINPSEVEETLRLKDQLSDMMDGVMARFDALLVANTLAPAPAVADFRDGKPRWTAMRTFPFNVTGQPALAVPMGVSAQGLPLGLQFAGPMGSEAKLCQIGLAFETDLNLRFSAIIDALGHRLG